METRSSQSFDVLMLIAGSPYDKCTNYTVVVFVMCRCAMFMLEFFNFCAGSLVSRDFDSICSISLGLHALTHVAEHPNRKKTPNQLIVRFLSFSSVNVLLWY